MPAVDQAEMLEVLLSYCATWQTLTNASSTPATAALFIHQEECDDDAAYPRATIVEGESTSQAVAISSVYSGTGRLWLVIDLVPDVTLETRKARRTWARVQVHTIKQEMEALSYGRTTPTGYSVSHLVLKSVRVSPSREVPQIERASDDENCNDQPEHVWRTELEVEYGN
jgi:hypothetical protein